MGSPNRVLPPNLSRATSFHQRHCRYKRLPQAKVIRRSASTRTNATLPTSASSSRTLLSRQNSALDVKSNANWHTHQNDNVKSDPNYDYLSSTHHKTQNQNKRAMQRRNGLVCRNISPTRTNRSTTGKASTPLNGSDVGHDVAGCENCSNVSRRRNATCGSPCTLRDARAVASLRSLDMHGQPPLHFQPTDTDVIFSDCCHEPVRGPQNNADTTAITSSSEHKSESLIANHENSIFRERLILYYDQMYKYTCTKTHRSIVLHAIYDELKSNNFRFFIRSPSPNGGYYELDDEGALRKIRHMFRREREHEALCHKKRGSGTLRNVTARSA